MSKKPCEDKSSSGMFRDLLGMGEKHTHTDSSEKGTRQGVGRTAKEAADDTHSKNWKKK